MSAPALSTNMIDLVHPRTYVEHGYPHDAWTELRRESPVHWIDRAHSSSVEAIGG